MKTINIFLGINFKKDKKLTITKRIINFFKKYDAKIYIDKNYYNLVDNTNIFLIENNFSMIDFCISIGGDGTFIYYAKQIKEYNIPIIGLNLGRVSYLSQLKIDNLEEDLKKLINKEYIIINQTMLDLDGNIALNDIYFHRGSSLKILNIEVSYNNTCYSFFADGLIISTPTGSSGYNYSAGGSIIDSSSNKFCITPICPNQKSINPLLIDDNIPIFIKINYEYNNKPILVLDGVKKLKIDFNKAIKIQKSNYLIKSIKFNN